jgi:uncharacterized damage-inducible protein DinB
MNMIEIFQQEMEQEALTTRKMLERIPDDKYDWQPHPKSMTIRQLSTHIAELPTWVSMTLNTSELDFAAGSYNPVPINNTAELMAHFETSLEDGRASLKTAKEEQLADMWTMRNGDHIISTRSKHDVIRMTFNQVVHHRAQLGVFLRLLDIPLPGSYGPTADDQSF